MPISALKGWNVASRHADWAGYEGPSLLELLAECREQAAHQRKVDGFFRGRGRYQIGHSGVGERMPEIQQRDAEEASTGLVQKSTPGDSARITVIEHR